MEVNLDSFRASRTVASRDRDFHHVTRDWYFGYAYVPRNVDCPAFHTGRLEAIPRGRAGWRISDHLVECCDHNRRSNQFPDDPGRAPSTHKSSCRVWPNVSRHCHSVCIQNDASHKWRNAAALADLGPDLPGRGAYLPLPVFILRSTAVRIFSPG